MYFVRHLIIRYFPRHFFYTRYNLKHFYKTQKQKHIQMLSAVYTHLRSIWESNLMLSTPNIASASLVFFSSNNSLPRPASSSAWASSQGSVLWLLIGEISSSPSLAVYWTAIPGTSHYFKVHTAQLCISIHFTGIPLLYLNRSSVQTLSHTLDTPHCTSVPYTTTNCSNLTK